MQSKHSKHLRVKTRNVESCATWHVQVTIAQDWFSLARPTWDDVVCSQTGQVLTRTTRFRLDLFRSCLCPPHHNSVEILMTLAVTDWVHQDRSVSTTSAFNVVSFVLSWTTYTSGLSWISFVRSVHAFFHEVEIRHICLFLIV